MLRKIRLGILIVLGTVLVSVGVARISGAAFPGLPLPPLSDSLTEAAVRGDTAGAAAMINRRCRLLLGRERKECFEGALLELTRQGHVRFAMGVLDRLGQMDSGIRKFGHDYSHVIGINAWAPGKDIGTTYLQCTELFQSGCYHGVIQAVFAYSGTDSASVAALCSDTPEINQSAWLRFQCVHGIGHGLLQTYTMNLPRALHGCDMLNNSWDSESCYGGAFMESVINATAPHHPATQLAAQSHHHMMGGTTSFKALDPKDPLYPCTIMADRYLHACYQMQTSVMLNLNHGDMGDAAKSCERAPGTVRPVCFQSLGRDITSYTNRDPQKTADMCNKAAEPYRPSCYFGAAKALVDWTATTDAAFKFCGIVGHEPGGPTCYQALGEEIATLLAGLPEREEQCLRAQEPQAIVACRLGAGVPASR